MMNTEKNRLSVKVKTARRDELEMDYLMFGEGSRNLVVLPGMSVHSITREADAVAALFQSWTGIYTVYVFDRARMIPDGYSVRDMAEDTARILETLSVRDADVYGASQGGMIALQLAADHPECVHSLTVCSTACRPNPAMERAFGEWKRLAAEEREEELLESFLRLVYSEETQKAYRDVLLSGNRDISREEFRRFGILAEACRTFDCRADLFRIRCPVWVAGSEGDAIMTAEASREIAGTIGCGLYLYDACYGHAVYGETPDFLRRCRAFFDAQR